MKNKQYWIEWAKRAGVRAIKTVAQTAVATIGTAAVIGRIMSLKSVENKVIVKHHRKDIRRRRQCAEYVDLSLKSVSRWSN